MSISKFLIFCFSLFSLTLYAQKSQIGFYLNPNIATTKLNGDYRFNQSSTHYYDLKEGNRIGFDAGLFYKYSVIERLKIGLGYSLKGFTILELTDSQNNYLLDPNTTRKVSYQYLEIPILITYSIIKKSWLEFYPIIAFSNNFLLTTPMDIFNENGIYKNGKGIYKRYNSGLQFGAGFSLHPSKRIAINLEPTEKIFLTPVTINKYPLSRRLYSFGLNIGLGYKF
jgi:opacity protein-like surface antigen